MVEKWIVEWTSPEGNIEVREYQSEHHAMARAAACPPGHFAQYTEIYATLNAETSDEA